MAAVLSPIPCPPPSRRRSTEQSRYAEALLGAFVRSGASAAEVRWWETPYDAATLYEALRRACRKKSWRPVVGASKCEATVSLYRR